MSPCLTKVKPEMRACMRNRSLPKNILVVKNRALGDALIGLSSIAYLKGALANPKVTYLVPQWIFPLFRSVRSDADEFLPLKLNSVRDFFNLFLLLFPKKYDLIIELHQRGRTAKFFKIYSFLTRTPYVFHNHNETERAPAIARDLKPCSEAVQRFIPESKKPDHLQFEPKLQVLGEPVFKKQMVFGIVATRKTKMWPIKFYKFLSDMLLKNDPDLEILVPLSNSSMDEKLEAEFRSLNPSSRVKFLKVGLEILPKELSGASVYIGNDTGMKHLCVALGMKTYTFFGPEEPFEWHPYNTQKHKFFFQENLSCRTKTSHYCGLETCESMICLNQFVPPKVFANLL